MIHINCNVVSILLLGVLLASCQQGTEHWAAIKGPFEKGRLVTNSNFKGEVWLHYLVESDSIHHVNIGSVTFAPGARTNWHYHQGGQILMVSRGRGFYQEKGKPVEIMETGSVVKCPPNIIHWHGATAQDTMTHIAIGTNTHVGRAVWLEPVTDLEYSSYTE